MSDFLTRNRLQLAKVETVSGTDAAPVPATDAVLVEEPRGSLQMELEQTDEVTGSLDMEQSIVGGGYMEHTCRIFLKGSGVPGTEPEFDPYLQGAAMSKTILAADEDDVAQAGTASSITLAAGATAADLTGFVITLDGGTGSGQTRVITGYDGGTKVADVYPDWTTPADATSNYIVHAAVMYAPASTGLKTITDYLYKKNSGSGNAILEKLLGGAVNLSLAGQTRQTLKLTATVRGILSDPEEVANPTGAVFDSVRPRPLRDADAYLGGAAVCFRNFTLDFGANVVQADCPGEQYGYESARVVSRKPTGRINPKLVTLTARNAFADLVAGTQQMLWLNYGETLGNKVSILIPKLALTNKEDDDNDGISADGLPFEAVGPDSWIYLLFY